MLVKVCGLRDPFQVSQIDTLSDFIGFIYYEKSTRYVINAPTSSRAIRTGVFVNATIDFIQARIIEDQLDCIQFHGDETPEILSSILGIKKIKAFGISEQFDFSKLKLFEDHVDYFLFDTKSVQYGGTGKQFNWEILEDYQGNTPFFLSGGINPSLVEKIKKINHPKFVGVDLNSGFEIAPAIKNVDQLKSFIHGINR